MNRDIMDVACVGRTGGISIVDRVVRWTIGTDTLGNILNALICLVHLRSATSLKQLPSLWVELTRALMILDIILQHMYDINGVFGFTTRRNTLLFKH